jgi:aminopeptidase YwaD
MRIRPTTTSSGAQPPVADVSAEAGETPAGPVMQSAVASSTSWGGFDISKRVARVSSARSAAGSDTDPMTHVNFLASKELLGRGSPSEGYNKASAYAAGLFQKYGLEPLFPKDKSGNGYFQTFSMFSFGDIELHGQDSHGHGFAPRRAPVMGRERFESGFFLDGLDASDKADILERLGSRGVGFAGRPKLNAESLARAGVAAGEVQNVGGIIRGTGPRKDEYLVFMAHLDHVGGRPERFHPGADDNASGSGTVLSALAALQQAAKDGKLDRSIIVLLTAAEEKGLVGSSYFVRNRPGAKEKIIEPLNADMLGRGPLEKMAFYSSGKSIVKGALLEANTALGANGFSVVEQNLSPFRDRQDGASFARAGFPQTFAFEGLLPNGDLHEDYHQPTDTPDKIIRDNGGKKLERFRDLLTDTLIRASNIK